MPNVYLSLGSNLGNRKVQLTTANTLLAERAGNILALSGFYETNPWGYKSDHPFLNTAIHLETPLPPFELLTTIQQIEQELGRIPKKEKKSYEDRPIDIDILLYENLISDNPKLLIPHPLITKRLFVLQPLAEIAPRIIHPILNRTVTGLLEDLSKNNK